MVASPASIVSGAYNIRATKKEMDKEGAKVPPSSHISSREGEKEHHLSAIQPRKSKTLTIGILQFIVGGIFVFGGIALLHFTTGTLVDMILGGIHTSLGVAAFPVGYGILIAKKWGRTSALALNPIAIAFSTLAEIISSSSLRWVWMHSLNQWRAPSLG